jgi:hypothetical protein
VFEIYDLVRVDHFVECPQGSHMANILVVLEKYPLSGKDADYAILQIIYASSPVYILDDFVAAYLA